MPIKKVRAANIRAAAKFWEKNRGYRGFRKSLHYDVIIDGEHFPPKAIVSIAHEKSGVALDMKPSSFKGARRGPWHDMLRNLGFQVVRKGLVVTDTEDIGQSATTLQDIEDIEEKVGYSPTERETLILARIGQGKYRRDLLSLWGNKCAVTGCSVLPVLRASHAKPWKYSEYEERLDPNNGLPLVANLDALFDAGLIGFDSNGKMLLSKNLRDKELLSGVPRALRNKPTVEQASYLEEHFNFVFQGVADKHKSAL